MRVEHVLMNDDRFDDGRMYKAKTDWYFERTKKEKQQFVMNSERSIWQLIIDQQVTVHMNDGKC